MKKVNKAILLIGEYLRETYNEAEKRHSDMVEFMQSIDKTFESNSYVIGTVLKAHLLIEKSINDLLNHYQNGKLDLTQARLTFHQKIIILESYADETNYYINGLKKINKIRNKIAHQLDTSITLNEVTELIEIAEILKDGSISDPCEAIRYYSFMFCVHVNDIIHPYTVKSKNFIKSANSGRC